MARPRLSSTALGSIFALACLWLASGCGRTLRVDREPLPPLERGPYSHQSAGWIDWRQVQTIEVEHPEVESIPSPEDLAGLPSLDETEAAIREFQRMRRLSGPAQDAAWPLFLETVDAYLDLAPERLSLWPLVRARVAAEFELDAERRRPDGAADELEAVVAGLLRRIDSRVYALRALAAGAGRRERPGREGELQWPLSHGVISSGFGARRDPLQPGVVRFHAAIDLAAPEGDPVYAAAAGLVLHAGWAGSAGRTVRISHAGGRQTLYAHLSLIMVAVGQSVHAGDVIGLVGNSGRSTGPHLHFAVLHGAKAVDPLDDLREVPMSFSEDMPGIVFGYGE